MTEATTTDASTATETAETATDSTAGESTTEATAAAETENAKSDTDWQDRFKAQQKVNRDLERKFKDGSAELAALKAQLDGKEAEHKAQTEAQRLQDEALSKANERILKAEVRANAASKLADPADALRFIDLSEFEVGSDGEVDSSAIAQAIDDLITSKPYLAAQSGGRFQGSADAGARNDASKVTQLSRSDMASMSPEQIDEAHKTGRFDNLMAGK